MNVAIIRLTQKPSTRIVRRDLGKSLHRGHIPAVFAIAFIDYQLGRDSVDTMTSNVHLVDFDVERTDELVKMWRNSFESAVIADPHPLIEQRDYLFPSVVPNNEVRLAIFHGRIVGFVAATTTSIAQLYVEVESQRQGIGTMMLDGPRVNPKDRYGCTLLSAIEPRSRSTSNMALRSLSAVLKKRGNLRTLSTNGVNSKTRAIFHTRVAFLPERLSCMITT